MATAPLSRRDWLKLSSASVVGYSVSGWLERLAAKTAEDPKRKRACILLWMNTSAWHVVLAYRCALLYIVGRHSRARINFMRFRIRTSKFYQKVLLEEPFPQLSTVWKNRMFVGAF